MVLMSLIKPLLPTVIPLFASTVVVVVEPLHTSSDLYYPPIESVACLFCSLNSPKGETPMKYIFAHGEVTVADDTFSPLRGKSKQPFSSVVLLLVHPNQDAPLSDPIS